MAASTVSRKSVSPAFVVAGAVALVLIIVSVWYLQRPAPASNQDRPSSEAVAYLPQLHISEETVKAADNLMRQQVVYVDGKITNGGSRTITQLDVYCIFQGIDGKPIYRERTAVVQAKAGSSFGPGQTRKFELPFDSLPDSWNQGLPNLVIAQIKFAE